MTSWRARATPALLAAPKPRLPSSTITSAPAARASAGPSSREPESTTTSWVSGGRWSRREAQQARQLGRGVVQDGDDREAHARRLGEQRVQRGGRALPGVEGGALARGGAQAGAQGVVAGDAQQGVGERAGVADRDAQRGVAQRLGEARRGR